jgi:putative Ca2+/H+ antiporter (TMEM165/GDT1 family)
VVAHGSPELFLLAYWTVLASELIGDRSILTVASLATRFRPAAVACGIAVAFMVKMLVAVLCGDLLSRLPVRWASALSAATLLTTALYLWLGKHQDGTAAPEPSGRRRNAIGIAFSAVFFAEWVDPGQISAAALAARSASPMLVWWAGTLALWTKGALAMTLGVSLRRRIPDRLARAAAWSSAWSRWSTPWASRGCGSASLRPQRLHGFGRQRAAGGNAAGRERHGAEQQRQATRRRFRP